MLISYTKLISVTANIRSSESLYVCVLDPYNAAGQNIIGPNSNYLISNHKKKAKFIKTQVSLYYHRGQWHNLYPQYFSI